MININISELRKAALSFRMADGYTPKSKLASTEMIAQGMQLIQQSPQLQQAYGTMLPSMFEHMMQLGGVRGLEEYNPRWQQQQPQPQAIDPMQNLLDASLQNGQPADPNAIPTAPTELP